MGSLLAVGALASVDILIGLRISSVVHDQRTSGYVYAFDVVCLKILRLELEDSVYPL